MTLHIFNPEHDLALASGLSRFTAPHAGRALRHDLGYLAALFASAGDAVLVDNAEEAICHCRRRRAFSGQFVEHGQLSQLPLTRVVPWGWDAALVDQLRRCGLPETLLPSAERLDDIRLLSHRRTAAALLPELRVEGTVGEAAEAGSNDELLELVASMTDNSRKAAATGATEGGGAVVKAPWSSSGRGVRFFNNIEDIQEPHNAGWVRNVLERQGSLMVEPLYRKVKDFAMEFEAEADGSVRCLGLSLFHTQNGAYTGNIIATEQAKRDMLGRYVAPELLDIVAGLICRHAGAMLRGSYEGCFGVDMMVVAGGGDGFLLHPCVEVNLRQTMGHAALALGQKMNPGGDYDMRYVMRIEYSNNKYKLLTRKLL